MLMGGVDGIGNSSSSLSALSAEASGDYHGRHQATGSRHRGHSPAFVLTATDPTQSTGLTFHVDWGEYQGDTEGFTGSASGTVATHMYPSFSEAPFSVTLSVSDDSGNTAPPCHGSDRDHRTASLDLQFDPADGLLIVTGTGGNDTITLQRNGSNLQLNVNGHVTTYPASEVRLFDASGFVGNDVIAADVDVPERLAASSGNSTLTSGSADDYISVYSGDFVIHRRLLVTTRSTVRMRIPTSMPGTAIGRWAARANAPENLVVAKRVFQIYTHLPFR